MSNFFVTSARALTYKYEDQSIMKVKSFGGNCMPPCKNFLVGKIKRETFMARKWKTSIDDFLGVIKEKYVKK